MRCATMSLLLLCVLPVTSWVRAGTNRDPGTKLPQVTAEVQWSFSEGASARYYFIPDRWITSVSIHSTDDRSWTIVPDMVAGEVVGKWGAIQICGICNKDHYYKRNRCVSLELQQAPTDANGVGEKFHKSVVGSSIRLGTVKYGAHWKLNGKEVLWQPTRLKKADQLECEWHALLSWAFTEEAREDPNSYVFSIGPIIYDNSIPDSVGYLLIARSDDRQDGKRTCSRPQLLPLTSDAILHQIKDNDNPVSWRTQLLVLLWDQPRPCPDADEVMLGVLEDAETYPAALRKYAAYNLIERRHTPCKPALFSLAADKQADAGLRAGIIGRFSSWPGLEAVDVLTAVAKGSADDKAVREAMVTTLAELGDEGRSVLETLKDDETIGKKVLNLLEALKKKDQKGDPN